VEYLIFIIFHTEILGKLVDIEHVAFPINNKAQLSLLLASTLETAMGGSSGAVSRFYCFVSVLFLHDLV